MSKIRLLFEAGPLLDPKKTGVGYYVGHLAASLQQSFPSKLELTGYYFNFLAQNEENRPKEIKLLRIWLIPGKVLSVCRRLGWQPWLELFTLKPSDWVLFSNYVSLPLLRKRKTALVIYDLGFLDHPEFTQERNLSYLQRFCPPSIRRADLIITISEFTKARLRHHFPDINAQIVVTPIPPSEKSLTVSGPLSSRLTNMGIRNGKYILYLGTIEPRKNLQALIHAYAQLDQTLRSQYSLVLAGSKGWKDESIQADIEKQLSSGLNILTTGYVSEGEKAALYKNAACFVLPSHYEGFGMPALEAMQHQTPVLLSDIPVFREVAGEAAEYFDKDSPADIAQKISLVLTNKARRISLISNSQAQLQSYSWSDNASRVFEAIKYPIKY